MGKTNEKLLPSCEGAKMLEGMVLKAGVSVAELDKWVNEMEL